jgi:hypothetical protein
LSGADPPQTQRAFNRLFAVGENVGGKQRLKSAGDNLAKSFTDHTRDIGGLLRAITFYSRPERTLGKI